jgi:nitronate monooxygenase
VQNWLTGRFRAAAGAQGNGELQSLWLGQAGRLATRDSAEAVFAELVAGLPSTA